MSNPIFEDMFSSGAIVLKHPADVVWPHLLRQAKWMAEFTIETVQGEEAAEGEIKKVTALPGQPEFLPFFFKTLLLIPYRRFVYKAYTEDRSGRYGFTGVEVLTLSEVGKDCAVTFEAYLEIQSPTMTREELRAFVSEVTAGSVAMWGRNFERLAALVANVSG